MDLRILVILKPWIGSCRSYTTIEEKEENGAFDEYNPDLYGGKREGYGFENADLKDFKDSGPSAAFTDETSSIINAEFKKRKGKVNIPKGKKKEEEEENIHIGFDPDCPLDDPGNASVQKLGWRVRLGYILNTNIIFLYQKNFVKW